ncbi:MAG: cytidylate kinase-like family protein [Deltaproteobacteria bacterium]|nr:cytidylate kinase-like family protein [Deltaproteobacteria bacterium]
MNPHNRTVAQIVDEQVAKWRLGFLAAESGEHRPVITISRDPGSLGRPVAKRISELYGLDLYAGNIIDEVAKNAHMSASVIRCLDERARTYVDDLMSSLLGERNLSADEYLEHLVKIIGTIGRMGHAVVLGRGANFILPAERVFKVRVIAPMAARVKHVMEEFGVAEAEATRRVKIVELDRAGFVRKYFHADISDPLNYDLTVNSARMSVDQCVDGIVASLPWKLKA